MSEYLWIGEKREIPGIGCPETNTTIFLPIEIATSFLLDGLCTVVTAYNMVSEED